MIRIANKRTHRSAGVYVGRPSTLGNPFVIGKDGDRAAVIQKYRRWLWQEMQHRQGQVYIELQNLLRIARTGDLTLVCWCHPEPCHADVLRACLEYLLQTEAGNQ